MSLLLVEDDRGDALLVEEQIADVAGTADIDLAWVQSISAAERSLIESRPDCVLLDLNLPDADGIDALHRLGKLDPAVPIIVPGIPTPVSAIVPIVIAQKVIGMCLRRPPM